MIGSLNRRFTIGSTVVLLATLAVADPAAGQDQATPSAGESLLQQQRRIDEQLELQRKDLAPLDSLLDWQWGGWLEYYVFHFDDGIQSQRVFQRPGLSLWTRVRIDDGAHEIFARMRMTYEYFSPGDEYGRKRDWVGPNLDLGWYQIDVGRALHLSEPADPLSLKIRVGRQQVRFGTGYTLDIPLDAVVTELRYEDFRLVGLLGKTKGSYANVDRSTPVANHSARCMWGLQFSYEGHQALQPFAFVLWNNDRTDERPKMPLQNYAYDTHYFGIGARGSVIHNLNYWVEAVYEGGESYGDGAIYEQDAVEAWGFDVGVEYLFDIPTRPFVSAEYMFGSGDSGRLFNATGAAGGNYGDERDTSFVPFGYRDTGLAGAPAVSNMHIWRAGAGFAPLEKIELCRDLEIGTNWFLYHKHHRRGAISDITADEFSGYVGWEMDYYINWRLASDLSWTARWGAFFPGQAYSERDMRNFFFTGITWSF